MRTSAALALLTLLASSASAARPPKPGPPRVAKVEPPSWWPGHSVDPVRLLIRGQDLVGAHVEPGPGLSIGAVRANQRGSYLFVDVSIDAAAAPGPRTLKLSTAGGVATASFEVLAPLAPEGRFAGITADDVVYLIMPDRFANGDPANDQPAVSKGLLDRAKARYYHGGDLQGIIDRLPYLKDLGVTTLWLNPWYDTVDHLNTRETYDGAAITDYHGYGAVDFYAVEEHFGTLAKLRELVDTAHAAGLKIVQDQVANHSSPYHPWLQDPPTPSWYNGSADAHLDCTWQTWTLADPHSTERMQRETLRGWFVNILPDLNQDDPEVARYIIQNTLWWVDVTGLDGIRQDTLPYVPRRFWSEWMAHIKREHPALSVVGEMFDGDPALVSFFEGGAARYDGIDSRIDTLFDFPLYYPIRSAFAQGHSIRPLAQMIARDRLYLRPGSLWTFLGLHDVPRFMSESGATTAGLELAMTFLLTARGTPLLYYGDELALAGGADPDNRRDFPGGFENDPASAFESAGRTPEQQAVWEHVRRLARLRGELAPLRLGATVHLLATEQAYVFARVTESGESVVVAFNNDTKPASLVVPIEGARLSEGTSLEDRLRVGPRLRVESGRISLALPARSAAVYAVPAVSH